MARLRIRMELNRGGVGVPLHKLASVVNEAQKFFRMLGDDVHIDTGAGEWLGFDFDNKSLNFTAEYVGPPAVSQVLEFQAAFDGVTLMRQAGDGPSAGASGAGGRGRRAALRRVSERRGG